ncbi:MAG: hypothetical protein CSB55_00485 [Candidatus Cloacimonadota bacterium]|nr:MAG: hypothetical protein CSB55_00485 [Candidatus Cloacimonadota bacterium]
MKYKIILPVIFVVFLSNCVKIDDKNENSLNETTSLPDSNYCFYDGVVANEDYCDTVSINGNISVKSGIVNIKKSETEILKFDLKSLTPDLELKNFFYSDENKFKLGNLEVSEKDYDYKAKIKFDEDNKDIYDYNIDDEWNIELGKDRINKLFIAVGIGELNFDATGIYIPDMRIVCGAGIINLDLKNFDLKDDANMKIFGVLGRVSLDISDQYPVLLKTSSGSIKRLEIEGLEKTSEGWVNSAYKKNSDLPVLTLDVTNKIGLVTINSENGKNKK